MAQLSHIMTLANSIIGVSVLAMPFCFKQCGIVLATLVLLLSCVLSRLACHFLVKSAVMSRRRNFELLAFHAFGHMGKFLVELFIIGFLVGTCIAFFVVMGDLGPQIMGKMIDRSPEDIRTSLLVITSVFIVLPLGLLRNIDSLSSICTATIVFYLCLVLKVMTESMQHIFAGDWYDHVYYWRPSGILQCLPIFSMALFCQTQLFEIYETIPNVSLEKMNDVVRGALNICTLVYLCVGFFGYIAFCTQPFTGNILLSFEPSVSSEMIKLGFVFSVAFSFPLVIFPCRASLNSLLFRRVYTHEPSINYLPEARFRCLTIAIVAISLITGILIPNIEFVLGLVGSTIGVMICLIFPAIFFISISSKHTNERLLAQAILFIGICIMILGTYANLYAMEESTNTKNFATTNKPLSQINNLPLNLNKDDIHLIANVPNNLEVLPEAKEKVGPLLKFDVIDKSLNLKAKDVRQEPPIPVERIIVTQKPAVETPKSADNVAATFAPEINKIVEKIKTMDKNLNIELKEVAKNEDTKVLQPATLKSEEKINIIERKEKDADIQNNDNLINSDAIKKEESELAADREAANNLVADRHEELRRTLEKYKLEQLQMIKEQKEILKDIKEQQQEIEREKQRMANDELKKNEERQKAQQGIVARKKNSMLISNFNTENDNRLKAGDIEKGQKVVRENKIYAAEQLNDKVKSAKEKETKNRNAGQEKEVETDFQDIQKDRKDDDTNNIRVNKLNDAKPILKRSNSDRLIKGPILNALTKRTMSKPNSGIDLKQAGNNTEGMQQDEHADNNSINVLEKSAFKTKEKTLQDQYSLPIALKMRNQTKLANTSLQSLNKSSENIQAIKRDILQNHEREKREADLKAKRNNTVAAKSESYRIMNSLAKNSTNTENQENCVKTDAHITEGTTTKPNKEQTPNETKPYTTEASLIKTNVYLSEHELPSVISVDLSINMGGEYVKVKQRDLKAVDSGGDSDI